MDLNLIFLCILNIIFFFSGLILNTLVIITILKTMQLRKKLCHFMIMVLSSCDLLTVVTCSLVMLFDFIVRFSENNVLYAKLTTYWDLLVLPSGLSMLTLMLICIERYFGVCYPIFHKTSVTRRKMLTLLAIFFILPTTITIICVNDLVISIGVGLSIYMAIYVPPFIFFNYKLFKISRKMCRQNATSSEKRRKIILKHINTCLLVVGCLVLFSVPCSQFLRRI